MHRFFDAKSVFIKNFIRSTRVRVSYKNTFITSWIELTSVVLPIVIKKAIGSKCMKLPNIEFFDVSKFVRNF